MFPLLPPHPRESTVQGVPGTWGGFLCPEPLRLLGDVSFVFLSPLWPSQFQGSKSFDLGVSEDMCVMIVSGVVWPSSLLWPWTPNTLRPLYPCAPDACGSGHRNSRVELSLTAQLRPHLDKWPNYLLIEYKQNTMGGKRSIRYR